MQKLCNVILRSSDIKLGSTTFFSVYGSVSDINTFDNLHQIVNSSVKTLYSIHPLLCATTRCFCNYICVNNYSHLSLSMSLDPGRWFSIFLSTFS